MKSFSSIEYTQVVTCHEGELESRLRHAARLARRVVAKLDAANSAEIELTRSWGTEIYETARGTGGEQVAKLARVALFVVLDAAKSYPLDAAVLVRLRLTVESLERCLLHLAEAQAQGRVQARFGIGA